jgi:hypothetical protein
MKALLNIYGYVTILIAGIIVFLTGLIIDDSLVLKLIIGLIGSILIAVAVLAVTVIR